MLERGRAGHREYFRHLLYVPELIRYYRCRRPVQVRTRCTYRERCGVCSKKNPSGYCTEKGANEETVQGVCSNCSGDHYALNRNCPLTPRTKLQRDRSSTRRRFKPVESRRQPQVNPRSRLNFPSLPTREMQTKVPGTSPQRTAAP